MKKLVKNKKGAEMTIGTIVVIVLALVVLVVLVVGFTQGWGNMWTWFTNLWGGGGTNLDAVINGCVTACSTKSQSAYCTQLRDVKFGDDKTKNGKYNCKGLEGMSGVTLEPCADFNCAQQRPCVAWGKTWEGTSTCAPESEQLTGVTDKGKADEKCCTKG